MFFSRSLSAIPGRAKALPSVTRPTLTRLSKSLVRVRALLESRRLPLLAALVAAALTSPSIFAGFATEDWVQRTLLRHGFPIRQYVNVFGHGSAWSTADIVRRNRDYQLYGWFTWVTDAHFDVSFWRPLASLTHHLDYRLWPDHPWIMHVESVLWYAALAAAVAALH